MAKIDAFFQLMAETGASDLHLAAGSQPILRVRGEMERIQYDPFDNDGLKAMLYEIAPEYKIKVFEETGDVDFGYEIPDMARYRANFFTQKYGVAAVFRQIPSTVLTAEQLGLPPILKKFAMLHRGMVLVTGPSGSGKSTTLAAMVDYANKNRKDHVITVEDPIEFVHKSQECHVNHREVGLHTKSFASALRGALREDPDIILVGEMRDLETIELALTAATTGHLVFGTLHTPTAPKTIDRVIDVFPRQSTESDPEHLVRGLEGHGRAESVQADRRQGSCCGSGDPCRHAGHRQLDPGGEDLPDPGNAAGRAEVRNADTGRLDHGSAQSEEDQPRGGLRQGERQEQVSYAAEAPA